MNVGAIENEPRTPGHWPNLAVRLTAVVGFTSRLGHRFTSVDFDNPVVLTAVQPLNPVAARWQSPDGSDFWMRVSARTFTVAVRFSPPVRPGRLVFWGVLNPSDSDNSISGVMVSRPHEANAVGKATRVGRFELSDEALCVIASGDLSTVADRDLLSLLAKGFAEAATSHDRYAWVSWLWDQVSQGHIRSIYVKKLCARLLGPHARRSAISKFSDSSLATMELLFVAGVFERGADYVLPSGMHSAVHVNLRVACGNPEVVRRLAEQVAQLLDDVKYDTIVSTCWPVAVIAREVMRRRPITAVGVVRHCEYEGNPPLPLTPVAKGNQAVLVTDTVVTGTLVARASEVIRAGGAVVKRVIAIVDARCSETSGTDRDLRAVCRYDVEATAPDSCPRCNHLERRDFNPVPSCMTTRKERPRSPTQFLNENNEAAEFWKQVDAARAYEHHRLEGNLHYTSFINTEKLLAHETVGPSILSKLAAQIPRLIGTPDVLLVPSKARARLLADKLLRVIVSDGLLWPPEVIVARHRDGRYQLAASESQLLREAKVLIVDTGVSSGATLENLCHLAFGAGAAIVGAAVVISRMSESQEAAVSGRLDGRFWRLYQLPIRPLSIPEDLRHLCPICSRLVEIEKAARESQHEPIVELCKEIRSRRARRCAVATTANAPMTRERQIRLMAEDEAPFLERCRRSTASGITLHSLHTAINDGMAPLSLPEICDDNIPATNRSAMLDRLGASAWQWSSSSLLPDAKRLLDERDPDEVWVSCAALLNQGSCGYWVEALEKRLTVGDTARQHGSKTIWNRLAYEVYALLKKEPSSLPEVRRRFQAMYRTCVQTPAEAGITPILEIIEKVEEDSRA